MWRRDPPARAAARRRSYARSRAAPAQPRLSELSERSVATITREKLPGFAGFLCHASVPRRARKGAVGALLSGTQTVLAECEATTRATKHDDASSFLALLTATLTREPRCGRYDPGKQPGLELRRQFRRNTDEDQPRSVARADRCPAMSMKTPTMNTTILAPNEAAMLSRLCLFSPRIPLTRANSRGNRVASVNFTTDWQGAAGDGRCAKSARISGPSLEKHERCVRCSRTVWPGGRADYLGDLVRVLGGEKPLSFRPRPTRKQRE